MSELGFVDSLMLGIIVGLLLRVVKALERTDKRP